MPANKIRFTICGSNYVINSTDSADYVLSLAEKLDADMGQTLATSPTASITMAAIITALTYLDESRKANGGADNMRAQIKDYLEDAASAKLAAEEAHREVEHLRREIAALKTQLATVSGMPTPPAHE
ncbi:MAG: cell division protein ZapA [Ruthenibacterium sp.]